MSKEKINPYLASSTTPEQPSRMRGVVYNPASPVAGRIAQNMTRREKRAVGVRMGIFGGWMGLTLAVPFAQLLALIHKGQFVGTISGICGLLIACFFASVPFALRNHSLFLCNAQWARQQGIEPKDL
jgi:hypothetical protein